MKKRLLFSLLAIFFAGLGLGGVSMAASCDEDAVACIGDEGYTTVAAAITAYGGNGQILINKTNGTEESLIIDKNVSLNLDGKTINACVTVNGGILIIDDEEYNSGKIICSGMPFVVTNGTLKMYGGTYEAGVDIRVKGNGSKAEIYDGIYRSVAGNTTAVRAYSGGVIDIHGGIFRGQIGSPKNGKCFWAGGGQVTGDTHGIVNIDGGDFDGRISASEGSEYHISGGSFAGTGVAKTAVCSEFNGGNNGQTGCMETDLDAFLEEGYAVSFQNGKYVVVYDPVATIGENGYSTVEGAISAASAGDTVEILKSGTYAFPTTILKNITIEGTIEVILDASGATSSTSIASIPNGATFSGITILFPNNTSPVEFGFYDAGNIEFNNCKIEGRFYTYGNTIYKNCELVGKGYPVTIYRGNVTFDGCTIESKDNTNGGYYLNAYNKGIAASSDHSKVEGPYTITIKDTTFKNSNTSHNEAKEKSAINIHEYYPNTKTILGYNVVMTNIILEGGNFPTKWYGGSEKWMIGDIMSDADTINGDPLSGDVNYGTENGGEIKVTVDGTTVYSTPNRGQNWIVTFDGTGAKEVADGAKVEKPTDPTKSCYTFSGWYNGNTEYDFNGVVTSDLALTAKWKNYSCGGGGSSSSSSSSSNKTGDNNTGATAESGATAETGANTPTVDPQAVASNGYTNEMNEAYEFAYANGITTKDSIEEAEMFDGLTRIAMAKMLSQYAINVLGKTPADVEVPTFIDVSADLDAEYANGVTLAYKLGIMGINMPDNKFLPYETVTRAQFGTALSRLLFGIEDGEDAYYSTHLKKLKEAGIITNDDPTLEELRGYVMLMLMRSSKGGNTVNTSTESAISNENTNTSVHEVANEPKEEQEVEAYFTEAYRKGQIYGRIGDLQRLLKSLGYYNGDINNTFDNNTIDAVFDFQIAMGILPADDKSSARGNVGPKTRDVLNQKWAEFNK